ncbi:MAG: hypothetical protein AB4352_21205 [Hormoscilla sp.]
MLDHKHYSPEEVGEIISDGFRVAIKMLREADRLMEPETLRCVDLMLLYDLALITEAMLDRHVMESITQAESDRERYKLMVAKSREGLPSTLSQ